MIGRKLSALTRYMLERNLCAVEQLESFMENATLMPASKRKGNGIVIARAVYTATFSIERYQHDPDTLFAHISLWLQAHDCARFGDDDLTDPDFAIDVLQDNLADIEINIRFYEEIELVPDDAGPFEFLGQRWRLDDIQVTEAQRIAVGSDQEKATDAPYPEN